MHQNIAVIQQQLYCGKISLAVLVPECFKSYTNTISYLNKSAYSRLKQLSLFVIVNHLKNVLLALHCAKRGLEAGTQVYSFRLNCKRG